MGLSRLLLRFTLLILAIFSVRVHAAPITYQGYDVTAFVEFAQGDLREVTAPFKLYHWDKGGLSAIWSHVSDEHDPIFAHAIQNTVPVTFRSLGPNGRWSEMFGAGFYLSVDPVATRSYGGDADVDFENADYGKAKPNAPWQLTEVTIPAGVSFLNLANAREFTPTEETTLSHFGCVGVRSAEDFFAYGGSHLVSSCADLVRFVYQTTLQIDAFSYRYDATTFKACENGLKKRPQDASLAFVLTSGHWITPALVSVRHAKSQGDLESRRLLQTLFAYDMTLAMEVSLDPQALPKAKADLLAQNPGMTILQGRVNCMSQGCLTWIYACPPGKTFSDPNVQCNSNYVILPPHITDTIEQSNFAPYGLLWSDLQDAAKSAATEVETYLYANRLGCDGTARYRSSNF